ncbi:MAG: Holliday junction branch migration protein RuvA, partial [Desulfofundulus sp.]
IGKKTAQRIILELKEKLGGLMSDEETDYRDELPEDDLARAALLELGYRPEEAQAALSHVAADLDPAARVRAALEVLRKR